MSESLHTVYPLLEELFRLKNLPLQPTYTNSDAASIFGVSTRTIQTRVADGSLPSRTLMGRARFLSCDLESFLVNSRKTPRI